MIRAAMVVTCLLHSCTNLIVTKGASAEGYNTLSYSADSWARYGDLHHSPARDHEPGTMRKIIHWSNGKDLGEIPEAAHTYNVVGNMNEFGLVLGETTWAGKKELTIDPTGKLDYGNLMYIALERCMTAREAWRMIVDLAEEYGYADSGETITLCDKKEIWLLDIIGRGPDRKGLLWVAIHLPDGTVAEHSNHPRTHSISELIKAGVEVEYRSDLIEECVRIGLLTETVPFEEFDWQEAVHGEVLWRRRYGEARTVSFFNATVGNGVLGSSFTDYLHGSSTESPPQLFYTPSSKISLTQMFSLMSDHLEGSSFDPRNDVGAGPYHSPHRVPPYTWTYGEHSYVNERTVSTPQTGWVFVAQCRDDVDDALGGMLWFAVDDAGLAVFVPHYSTATAISKCVQRTPTQNSQKFSFNSLFWVSAMLNTHVYQNFLHINPEIQEKRSSIQTTLVSEWKKADKVAQTIAARDGPAAKSYVTQVSIKWEDDLLKQWMELYTTIFPRFQQGMRKKFVGKKLPEIERFPYQNKYYERIVKETGDKYLVPTQKTTANGKELDPLSQLKYV
ncbi:putative C69 family dipeptidase [Blattamonas nauphoetae]|uniref:C69 family dipeptidase n=1 Tax=Blattamonas nauphoetae TaxID=2049346 RepID=A0ABQ9XL40_9EUKA|nr:putative C69 family dipeptidase [Blattamonas nauphoetae]